MRKTENTHTRTHIYLIYEEQEKGEQVRETWRRQVMGHLRLHLRLLLLLLLYLLVHLFVCLHLHLYSQPAHGHCDKREENEQCSWSVSISISLCTSSAANTSMLSEMKWKGHDFWWGSLPPVTRDIHLCGRHPDLPGLQEARALQFIETVLLFPIPGTGLWFAGSFQLQPTSPCSDHCRSHGYIP